MGKCLKCTGIEEALGRIILYPLTNILERALCLCSWWFEQCWGLVMYFFSWKFLSSTSEGREITARGAKLFHYANVFEWADMIIAMKRDDTKELKAARY